MSDVAKPPNAPSHIGYFLNEDPPRIVFNRFIWAPLILKRRHRKKETVTSGDKNVISEEFCVLRNHGADDQLAWIFGRGIGNSLLVFRSAPLAGNLPDLQAHRVRAVVNAHVNYKLMLDSPNLMVIAPDKDLTSYKLDKVVKANDSMDAFGLFTMIRDQIETTVSKRIRNLVFQCHGTGGQLWIFGRQSSKRLNKDNVTIFNKLSGKVDAIWILSCITCADQNYMKSIAMESKAYIIGATTSNPQKRLGFKKGEIEFYTLASPVAMNQSGKYVYLGDLIGQTSKDSYASIGVTALAHFTPA